MFRISARTVLELGSELISSDIVAFYELIKNGFDAQTKNGVTIKFDIVLPKNDYLRIYNRIKKEDDITVSKATIENAMLPSASVRASNNFKAYISKAKTKKALLNDFAEAQARFNTITISDTGTGMSLTELRDNYLVIGTASRKREVDKALFKGMKITPYLGEKGIGRLSAMRLGERLRVETGRTEDIKLNLLEINWRDFSDIEAMLDQVPVDPEYGDSKPSADWSGTSIIVSDLSEHWTDSRVKDMVKTDFSRLTDPFANANSRPRIAIYWNNERLSIPIMPKALLDACHAKISGEYKIVNDEPVLTCLVEVIDLGFEHPREHEVVTMTLPDLQGAIIGKDSTIDDGALLSIGPFKFEAYWYNRRRLGELDSIGDRRTVLRTQEHWSGILLFRDGFRVFPYGEDDDDWLSLDRKALRRSGYTLNKTQFLGWVSISRTTNPNLLDQTNREGLRVTAEQQVLLEILRYGVQDLLGKSMIDIEKRYKSPKLDLSNAHEQIQTLERRAKEAVKRLKRITPPEGSPAVEELQEVLREFSEFAENARTRISQVEQESRQMIDMAGVGLMVEVVAHELARASENALKTLDSLRGDEIPSGLKSYFNTLQAEMKSVSKRVRILDPMSASGRQRNEIFSLDELIREIIEAHAAQFERHKVKVTLTLLDKPIRIRAVKGMIVQIIENLISNSIYWMDTRVIRESRYQPHISIQLLSGPPTLIYEDNGPGISPASKEQVFKLFFSLKETTRRRGLGLYIAQDAAQHHGGTLILDDEINPQTGRLHKFIMELPKGVQV